MALTVTNPIVGTPEMEQIKRIFEEAFPPEERIVGIEDILSREASHINAYYDGDALVGFLIWFDVDWFDYVLFFAVDSSCRGGGYGGQIWDEVVSQHATRPFYFSVEDPDETPAANTEQRVKRVRFYEKHGCSLSELSFMENPRMRLMYYHTPERAADVVQTLQSKIRCMVDSEFICESGVPAGAYM
ncbi:MAG: GNAT family N-acetyltransferase [Bacteroidales bacterium]|nr:GNAT family N-acetyltransferase [Bacteroidales bacterium]